VRRDTAALLREHLDAFNAHDTTRLLAGLAPDAVWRTGRDTARGTAELADLFDQWLWDLDPSLEVRHVVAGEESVAAELVERLTLDGVEQVFPIAVFLRFRDDLVAESYLNGHPPNDLAS
jgi:ketosteroid isomerase-like protein